MAEYRKKRRSKFKTAPKINKKAIKQKDFDEIKMSSSAHENNSEKKKMRVVRGRKFETRRNLKKLGCVLAILIIVIIICHFLIPAGIAETVTTSLKVIGSGSYPISLESGDNLTVISKNSYYYVLSSKNLSAFSNSGKKIFTYSHGLENPVLKTSKTRALLFDQGKNDFLIFTLSGLKYSDKTENEIINAAIGDDGTYAFATFSEKYASQVSVFKSNNKIVYEWFSSENIINNVAVSPRGNKIAVSTIISDVGKYNSAVNVFNFDSATPENQKNYENTVIYSLEAAFSGRFFVATVNEFDYIKWSNFEKTEYKNDYNTAMIRTGNDGIAIVYNRENDKTDNRIAIFSRSGKLKKEIKFKGIINDFVLHNGYICCLSDNKSYILDDNGNVIRSAECGFGAKRISKTGQNTLAVITDSEIFKIKLEQE